jgi:hypothetical protein
MFGRVSALPAAGSPTDVRGLVGGLVPQPGAVIATTFGASADGQRFLTIAVTGEDKSSPIVIRTGRRR